jgi:MFS family permease
MGLTGLALAPTPTVATVPLALVPIGTMLLTVPAAHLMSRRGRKAGFIIGAALGVVGAGICTTAVLQAEFYLLCVGAFCTGSANGFSTYYRFAATEVVAPEWKSRAISYVMGAGIASALLGSRLAPWSQTLVADYPFAGAFLCIGALQALMIVVLPFSQLPLAQLTAGGKAGRSLLQIAQQTPLLIAILGAVTSWMIMSLLMHATPLSMQRAHHSFADTTQVIMCHALAMYGPAFFTGHLIARFGEWRVMLAGLLLTSAAATVNLGGSDLVYYYIGLTLLGLGWNFLFIGSTSLLVESHTPEEKAKVQSTNDSLIFASMILSSFSAGSLEHLVGWTVLNEVALMTMVAVTVVMVFLHLKGPGAAKLPDQPIAQKSATA